MPRSKKGANARPENATQIPQVEDTFKWNEKSSKAAVLLANGYTQGQAAESIGVGRDTVNRWYSIPAFRIEVGKLALISGMALRSERLMLANRQIRKLEGLARPTGKDLLDWMKFAQSETDGAKFDIRSILESGSNSSGD